MVPVSCGTEKGSFRTDSRIEVQNLLLVNPAMKAARTDSNVARYRTHHE